MRIAASVIVCAGLTFATAAGAQQAPTPTVEDYLCALAGECGDSGEDDGPEISRDAPETSGARLAWRTEEGAGASAGARLATKAGNRPGAAVTSRSNRSTAASAVTSTTQQPAPRYSRRRSAIGGSAAHPTRVARAAVGHIDMQLVFELGSANLTPAARQGAETFAKFVQHPAAASKQFRIEGHTDSIGGEAYNMDLSQRRAEAVAEYLVGLGVERQRLDVKGYGFAKPLPGRSTRSASNRRVEAVVVP